MQNIAVMYFNYQILPTSLNIYLTGIYEILIFHICLGIYFFFRIKVLLGILNLGSERSGHPCAKRSLWVSFRLLTAGEGKYDYISFYHLQEAEIAHLKVMLPLTLG